jgi:hypothetical protein
MALFEFKSDRKPQTPEKGGQQSQDRVEEWVYIIIFAGVIPVAVMIGVQHPEVLPALFGSIPRWVWWGVIGVTGGIPLVLLLALGVHAIVRSAVRAEISSMDARLSRMKNTLDRLARVPRADREDDWDDEWDDDDDWDDDY